MNYLAHDTVAVLRCESCLARRDGLCAVLSEVDQRRLAAAGRDLSLAPGAAIFAEGDRAEWGFVVKHGMVRLSRLLASGDRQVFGFLRPGHFFGWTRDGGYGATAEAVTRTTLCRLSLRELDAMARARPDFERRLRESATDDLDAALAQVSMLIRKTAVGKVSAFVLYFAEQERRHACTPWFDMPMKREDIADYLGTATETVCRCFRQLAEERLVEFENVHRARIRDAAALTAYADAS